jgi:hypothetical protein
MLRDMSPGKALGAVCVLLSLYYLQFFVRSREPVTVVQIAILLCAAAVSWLRTRPLPASAAWFPARLALLIILIGAAVLLFVVADSDSHSASDTFTRVVPTYTLMAAIIVRMWRTTRSRASY